MGSRERTCFGDGSEVVGMRLAVQKKEEEEGGGGGGGLP